MTVTTSYPGVYIQELPSLVHSITPAPTSIAVFIGYTHPLLTKNFQTNPNVPTPAIQLFSFADYQTNFGGFFYSPWQPDYVGQAVHQFFLNGGPTCYVVGLPAQLYYQGTATTAPATPTPFVPATAVIDGITFTALQPVANTPPPPAATTGTATTGTGTATGGTGTGGTGTGGTGTGGTGTGGTATGGTGTTGTGTTGTGTTGTGGTTGTTGTGTTGTGGTTGGTGGTGTTGTGSTGTGSTTPPVVGIPMQVQFSNYRPAQVATATSPATDPTVDIVIYYGTTVETYRKVSLASLQATAVVQSGGSAPPSVSPALQNSTLVRVAVSGSAALPTAKVLVPLTYGDSLPLEGWTVIDPSGDDFGPVFAENASLDKVPIFNLLATPGFTGNTVTSEAVAYCERKRAFYIMDTPSPSLPAPPLTTPPTAPAPPQPDPIWNVNNLVQDTAILSEDFPVSTNAALYYPWLVTTDPVTGAPATAPPSGFVAGMYGQEDNARGVWKSPAGIETALLGTTGVDPNGVMNDNQQGVLNVSALDCLRQFPGIGTVIFGARTTAGADVNTAQQQWKYVAVRRMALFIEQSLYASLTWAVFEGNATPLWNALTQEVTAFMLSLFRQNAFAGNTPSQAFLVQCDSTTTTPTDVANGIVNILVGFAPLVPAEFVVVQIAQLAGQAQS